MISSPKFLSLLTTLLLSTLVLAAPWPHYARHATHRKRELLGNGVVVEAYNPKSEFKTFGSTGASLVPSGSSLAPSNLKDNAMAYVTSLGHKPENLAWKSGFVDGQSGFAYLRQAVNGIPVANSVCNLVITNGSVSAWGSSFVDLSKAKSIAPSTPTLSWTSLVPDVESKLDATYNQENVTLEYFVKDDGRIALTHVLQAQNNATGAWYEAYVDAHTGEIVSINDFVAHSSFKVVPATKQSLDDGLVTLTDPEDTTASPLGWNALAGGRALTTTSGNNVVAFSGNSLGVQSSAGNNFDFTYDDSLDPTVAENKAAALTNAFYILNTMHDVTYRYGFTEDKFNFQVAAAAGQGGRARDRVEVSVQDASGTNNANFATPPDGQPGQCRMFIWTLTTPNRDGAMENDIIIHEFAHGVTNRLTGGGTGRCLQSVESGGLGEGWGDAMANWMAQESADTRDFVVGNYVTNTATGIRRFPYSTSATTNPLRYSTLRQFTEVHDIGEVWANMLHNVYAALVDEKGFAEDKLTNPDAEEGNVVFMRLFMDALQIQPCNPTFVQARDAWIQADQNRFGGANRCTLFRAFASRGLGLNANGQFRDDTTVPADC